MTLVEIYSRLANAIGSFDEKTSDSEQLRDEAMLAVIKMGDIIGGQPYDK